MAKCTFQMKVFVAINGGESSYKDLIDYLSNLMVK